MVTNQTGLTLLEVLIALSLLTIALLLAAYPLHQAKNAMHNALMTTYASISAEDVAARIRINTDINQTNGTDYGDSRLWNSIASTTCTNNCSAIQNMRKDANELQTMWQQFNPQANMRITNCQGALCAFFWWNERAFSNNRCVTKQCVMFTFLP